MEKFLEQLYSYENFGIYLTISIVVLVILFFVILFFGKKDQREREKTATLKLQQINNEAFKEDSVVEKVEVPEVNQNSLENDTIIVPNINNLTEEVSEEIPEPVLPTMDELNVQEVSNNEVVESFNEPTLVMEPVVETPVNVVEETVIDDKFVEPTFPSVPENTLIMDSPILPQVEEKPLMFNEEENVNNVYNVPTIETVSDTAPIVEQEEVEVPTFNFDEIIKSVEEAKPEPTYTKGPEIFSSVYVPKKEVVEEPVMELPKVEVSDDEFEFELPTLKKEVEEKVEPTKVVEEVQEDEIEMPVLNDYNLDELSGETYMINK